MKRLSEAEYLATLAEPMKRVPEETNAPFDFWEYFDAIPKSDFENNEDIGSVTYVWNHPDGRYQHVLIDCTDPNVFMTLVLDLTTKCVLGHRLVDLNHEYGLQRNK